MQINRLPDDGPKQKGYFVADRCQEFAATVRTLNLLLITATGFDRGREEDKAGSVCVTGPADGADDVIVLTTYVIGPPKGPFIFDVRKLLGFLDLLPLVTATVP